MAAQLYADSTADNLSVRQYGEPEKKRQLAAGTLTCIVVSPKPRQAYGYTAPDFVSNTAVRHYTLTSICEDWARRVIDWMGMWSRRDV